MAGKNKSLTPLDLHLKATDLETANDIQRKQMNILIILYHFLGMINFWLINGDVNIFTILTLSYSSSGKF